MNKNNATLRAQFGPDFEFGTATSAYQIEGHQFGGAGRTHWDDFAATPGNVVRAEHGAVACDHYHRYAEDFDLIQAAGFDSYRFSTSWARVLPEGRGAVNQEGLDYYDRLVDALLERGLKPNLTLYHWELPSALADLGGWRNRDIAHWFADYAQIIAARLGDRLHAIAPINEPWCVSFLSHFVGAHAPGLRDIRAAVRSMHHVLLAHGTAITALREMGQTNLGGVFNLEWSGPADETPAAQEAALMHDAYYNRFFLEGVFQKSYPNRLMPTFEPHLPKGWQDDFDTIGAPLDWCGINYYTRSSIAPSDGPWPHHHAVAGPLPKTQMGWEIYPEGLYKFLMRLKDEYNITMPIYVTENGMAHEDQIAEGQIADPQRIAYIQDHLDAVARARNEGVNVQGYYVWSLLDNYEWALGYEKRFGLIHVDFDTLERTPKASYHWLKDNLSRPAP